VTRFLLSNLRRRVSAVKPVLLCLAARILSKTTGDYISRLIPGISTRILRRAQPDFLSLPPNVLLLIGGLRGRVSQLRSPPPLGAELAHPPSLMVMLANAVDRSIVKRGTEYSK